MKRVEITVCIKVDLETERKHQNQILGFTAPGPFLDD